MSNDLCEILTRDRALTATNARRAIRELRVRLDRMEAAIDAGESGEPIRTDELVPNHQYVAEVQTLGAEYRTLWNAVGVLRRADA